MKRTFCSLVASVAGFAAIAPAPAQATFPGRNGLLLAALNDRTTESIQAVDPSGGPARMLLRCDFTTASCPLSLSAPSVSSDGRTVAFAATDFVDTETYRTRISLIDIASGHLTTLPGPRNEGQEGDPSWFPGGTQLAFDYKFIGIARGIRTVRVDGSRRMTLESCDCYQPAVSPRGRFILFVRAAGGEPAVWIVRSDGTHARRLVSQATEPAWAPDGRRIAFVSVADHRHRIVTEDLSGRHRRTLASKAADPVWSPDGRLIAFLRPVPPAATSEILTMRATGGGLRRVFVDPSAVRHGGIDRVDWQALTP